MTAITNNKIERDVIAPNAETLTQSDELMATVKKMTSGQIYLFLAEKSFEIQKEMQKRTQEMNKDKTELTETIQGLSKESEKASADQARRLGQIHAIAIIFIGGTPFVPDKHQGIAQAIQGLLNNEMVKQPLVMNFQMIKEKNQVLIQMEQDLSQKMGQQSEGISQASSSINQNTQQMRDPNL
jgi:hypothetical protein